MSKNRRLFAALLLTTAALVSCDPEPTTICIGGPPQCNSATSPETVSVSPGVVTLSFLGETAQLTGTVLDQLGLPMDTVLVTWSSAEVGVASVASDGVVTAVGPGTAVITASAPGATGSATVTVAQAPTTVTVTPDPVDIPGPGAAAVLTTSAADAGGAAITEFDMTWSTDDTNVATVIDDGVVTGIAQGQTIARVQVTNGGVTTEQTVTVNVSAPTPGTVTGVVRDAATSLALSGASVSLAGPGGPFNTTTDGSGIYTLTDVAGGTYDVSVSGAGYVTGTAVGLVVADGVGDVVRADFALTPGTSTQRFGGLSGKVTFGGAPLAGASVTISGGDQTNGIFQSTTTDANGNYSLVGINMDDTSGQPIAQFTVLSTRGFSAASENVSLVQNQTLPNVDLDLEPSSGLTLYFEDDFESASPSWEMTGFWNRSMLSGITNAAYPTYVRLAPSDDSGGNLPAPIQGQYAYWYGDPATGNFLGTQVSGDSPGSGGTSESSNDGKLTSPSFTIPSGAPTATLRFNTWFEVESVNPNDSGFDIMEVGVIPEGQTSVTVLARLNPFVDPTLPDRDDIPFTSGGFNKVPVWRTEFIEMNDYIGQTVQLVFEFRTVDGLYNGFRGWVIDEVSVSSLSFGAPTLPPPSVQVGSPPQRTR